MAPKEATMDEQAEEGSPSSTPVVEPKQEANKPAEKQQHYDSPINTVLDINLDDLEIDEKEPLGHGGFCMVYKAHFKKECSSDADDRENRTVYALKKLKAGVRKAILAREHLEQEANFLASLRHENIVFLLGRGFDKETNSPFLLTEVLADTLEHYVEKWQSKSSHYFAPYYAPRDHVRARLRQIVLGICQGMAYMHAKNIVFRDLKPDNIGFTSRGQIKLFDLGLAVRLEPPHYKCLQQAGTVRYLAPEIIKALPYDTKVDVYSFSILLWQIITGRLPFEKELGVDDGFKISSGKTKFLPPSKRPSLQYVEAEELKTLLKATWHPRPDDRPTFPEIISTLQEFLGPTAEDTEPTIFKIRMEPEPEVVECESKRRERHPEPDPLVWWSA